MATSTDKEISGSALIAFGSHLSQNGSAQKNKAEGERRSKYELSGDRE